MKKCLSTDNEVYPGFGKLEALTLDAPPKNLEREGPGCEARVVLALDLVRQG